MKKVYVFVDNKSVGEYILNIEDLKNKKQDDLITKDIVEVIYERASLIDTKKYYFDKFIKENGEYNLYLNSK